MLFYDSAMMGLPRGVIALAASAHDYPVKPGRMIVALVPVGVNDGNASIVGVWTRANCPALQEFQWVF